MCFLRKEQVRVEAERAKPTPHCGLNSNVGTDDPMFAFAITLSGLSLAEASLRRFFFEAASTKTLRSPLGEHHANSLALLAG